jgi:hypothetical protein
MRCEKLVAGLVVAVGKGFWTNGLERFDCHSKLIL